MADAMRYLAEGEIALVLVVQHNVAEVGNNLEIVGAQGAQLASAGHEMDLGIAREGAQEFAGRQVDAVDGDVGHSGLGEDIGMEADAHLVGDNLDVVDVR